MIRDIVRVLLPSWYRNNIRYHIDSMVRKLKSPHMRWGYRNLNGEWQEKTRISDTVYFNHPERIIIEDNVYVGHFSILDGTGRLLIEEGAQLAGWNGIYTHSSHISIRLYGRHYQEIPEYEKIGYVIKPVIISKYAFIGAGAIILPGVKIGQGALVAAGTIVRNDVEQFQVVAGNSSNVIGCTKDIDEEYLRDRKIKSWYEEWQKS